MKITISKFSSNVIRKQRMMSHSVNPLLIRDSVILFLLSLSISCLLLQMAKNKMEF